MAPRPRPAAERPRPQQLRDHPCSRLCSWPFALALGRLPAPVNVFCSKVITRARGRTPSESELGQAVRTCPRPRQFQHALCPARSAAEYTTCRRWMHSTRPRRRSRPLCERDVGYANSPRLAPRSRGNETCREGAAPDFVELLDSSGEIAHASEGVLVGALVRRGADLLEGVEMQRMIEIGVEDVEQPQRHLIVILAHVVRATGVEAAEVAGREGDGWSRASRQRRPRS